MSPTYQGRDGKIRLRRKKQVPSPMANFNYRFNLMPAEPPRWELFLVELGIGEDQVLDHLGRVRPWVEKHYMNRFVPERVLKALSLSHPSGMDWRRW